MQRALVLLSLLAAAAHGLNSCVAIGDGPGGDCTAEGLAGVCFMSLSADNVPIMAGCVSLDAAENIESGVGCWPEENDPNNVGGLICTCDTGDACNTQATFDGAEVAEPPAMCYAGLAGINEGARCGKSDLWEQSEFKDPANCGVRLGGCYENNESYGEDNRCRQHQAQGTCEAQMDNGHPDCDGDHCQEPCHGDDDGPCCAWLPTPPADAEQQACEADANCQWEACAGPQCDSPDNHHQPCQASDAVDAERDAWETAKNADGGECEQRSRAEGACRENNGWLGEASRCADHGTQGACAAQAFEDDGVSACSQDVGSSYDGTDACCVWLPAVQASPEACDALGSGLCQFVPATNDMSHGLSVDPKLLEAATEHGLIRLSSASDGACSTVLAFRQDKGLMFAAGADQADFVGGVCRDHSATFDELMEHIGFDADAKTEYCANFLPGTMEAQLTYSPAQIIAKVKQGRFDKLFPTLAGLPYIVHKMDASDGADLAASDTECMFFGSMGVDQFAGGFCTCQTNSCNSVENFGNIVENVATRLLSFVDGTLGQFKDDINAIVPGLISADGQIGIFDEANGGFMDLTVITDDALDQIMLIPGVADLATKADIQRALDDILHVEAEVADYKTSLPAAVTAASISPDEVATANAIVPGLYDADGAVDEDVLYKLSDSELEQVAGATGLDFNTLMYAGEFSAFAEGDGAHDMEICHSDHCWECMDMCMPYEHCQDDAFYQDNKEFCGEMPSDCHACEDCAVCLAQDDCGWMQEIQAPECALTGVTTAPMFCECVGAVTAEFGGFVPECEFQSPVTGEYTWTSHVVGECFPCEADHCSTCLDKCGPYADCVDEYFSAENADFCGEAADLACEECVVCVHCLEVDATCPEDFLRTKVCQTSDWENATEAMVCDCAISIDEGYGACLDVDGMPAVPALATKADCTASGFEWVSEDIPDCAYHSPIDGEIRGVWDTLAECGVPVGTMDKACHELEDYDSCVNTCKGDMACRWVENVCTMDSVDIAIGLLMKPDEAHRRLQAGGTAGGAQTAGSHGQNPAADQIKAARSAAQMAFEELVHNPEFRKIAANHGLKMKGHPNQLAAALYLSETNVEIAEEIANLTTFPLKEKMALGMFFERLHTTMSDENKGCYDGEEGPASMLATIGAAIGGAAAIFL